MPAGQLRCPRAHPGPVLRSARRRHRRGPGLMGGAAWAGPGENLVFGDPRRWRRHHVGDLAVLHANQRRAGQVRAAVAAAAPGSHTIVSSGLSTSGNVDPGHPGYLPGLRPEDVRDERGDGLRYGGSHDGGLLEVDESSRARRSSSTIRAACASTCAKPSRGQRLNLRCQRLNLRCQRLNLRCQRLDLRRLPSDYLTQTSVRPTQLHDQRRQLRRGRTLRHPPMITEPRTRSSGHANDHPRRPVLLNSYLAGDRRKMSGSTSMNVLHNASGEMSWYVIW